MTEAREQQPDEDQLSKAQRSKAQGSEQDAILELDIHAAAATKVTTSLRDDPCAGGQVR